MPRRCGRPSSRKGARLTLSEGAYCELWLRKSIPDEKKSAAGALFPGLTVSTAVGVIRFLAPASDFRGQAIKPGLYTLRYALMPSDGAHMGVSEYPDYLLAIPAADDPDPDAVFKFADLMDLSRKATGTRHPGVFSLTRPSGTSFPAAATNDQGHVVLQVKARLKSGETRRWRSSSRGRPSSDSPSASSRGDHQLLRRVIPPRIRRRSRSRLRVIPAP